MTTDEFDKKNCTSYNWCKKYGPKELNCPDCDHYIPSIDSLMNNISFFCPSLT